MSCRIEIPQRRSTIRRCIATFPNPVFNGSSVPPFSLGGKKGKNKKNKKNIYIYVYTKKGTKKSGSIPNSSNAFPYHRSQFPSLFFSLSTPPPSVPPFFLSSCLFLIFSFLLAGATPASHCSSEFAGIRRRIVARERRRGGGLMVFSRNRVIERLLLPTR
jgi:hypothetical protein